MLAALSNQTFESWPATERVFWNEKALSINSKLVAQICVLLNEKHSNGKHCWAKDINKNNLRIRKNLIYCLKLTELCEKQLCEKRKSLENNVERVFTMTKCITKSFLFPLKHHKNLSQFHAFSSFEIIFYNVCLSLTLLTLRHLI